MGQSWCRACPHEGINSDCTVGGKPDSSPLLVDPAEAYLSPETEVAADEDLNGRGSKASALLAWEGTYDPTFVNSMMMSVWPMVDKFSKRIVTGVVQPAVKKALGALGENFEIDEASYTLGDKSVQFGPLQISDSQQHTGDPNEPMIRVMTVRTQIAWESELQASASLGGVKMGITELRLEGDLVMELVGECPTPPLFEGARACFMKPPKLSLNVHSGVELFDHLSKRGPVRDAIVDVVTDQLSAKLVVPNRMGVKLVSTADIFRTLHPPPRGMLRLTISHAEGLLAKDWNLFGKATSDPLVLLICGALKFNSPTVPLTTSPEFNYEVLIPVNCPAEQFIILKVLDHDVVTADDFLGQKDLSVKDLVCNGPSERSYELEDENGNLGNRGRIWLKAEWRELVATVKPLPHPAGADPLLDCCHLFFGVYRANHVPVLQAGTKYWVEIQCTGRCHIMAKDGKVSQPKATPKVELKALQQQFDEERQVEDELWQERKTVCKKYKMSSQDMAKVLGVSVEGLDRKEDAYTSSTVEWNNALPFFLSKDSGNAVTISLKYQSPTLGDAPARRPTKRSTFRAAVSALGVKVREKVSQTLGEDASHLVHTWEMKVADIVDVAGNSSTRMLKVPGQPTSLQLHVRLMEMGDPSIEL